MYVDCRISSNFLSLTRFVCGRDYQQSRGVKGREIYKNQMPQAPSQKTRQQQQRRTGEVKGITLKHDEFLSRTNLFCPLLMSVCFILEKVNKKNSTSPRDCSSFPLLLLHLPFPPQNTEFQIQSNNY
jgi:hypothetical protein